jgi:hypothetical protein
MNRIVPAVVAVAAVVAVTLILLLRTSSPQYPKMLNISAISYPNGVYLYDVYVGDTRSP